MPSLWRNILSVSTPCRSRETTIGTSSPKIARASCSSRPSGSWSFSAAIAPCRAKYAPSAGPAFRMASENSVTIRSKSLAARVPPEVMDCAL